MELSTISFYFEFHRLFKLEWIGDEVVKFRTLQFFCIK